GLAHPLGDTRPERRGLVAPLGRVAGTQVEGRPPVVALLGGHGAAHTQAVAVPGEPGQVLPDPQVRRSLDLPERPAIRVTGLEVEQVYCGGPAGRPHEGGRPPAGRGGGGVGGGRAEAARGGAAPAGGERGTGRDVTRGGAD